MHIWDWIKTICAILVCCGLFVLVAAVIISTKGVALLVLLMAAISVCGVWGITDWLSND